MATATYKTLGRVSPADTNNADLYTVGSAVTGGAVLSTVAVANTTGSAAAYRIFVRNNSGDTAAQSNAIGYDVAIAANDTVALTLGISLSAGQILTVRSNTANALNFFAFGSEIVN